MKIRAKPLYKRETDINLLKLIESGINTSIKLSRKFKVAPTTMYISLKRLRTEGFIKVKNEKYKHNLKILELTEVAYLVIELNKKMIELEEEFKIKEYKKKKNELENEFKETIDYCVKNKCAKAPL